MKTQYWRPEEWNTIKAKLISELLDGFDESSYANGLEDGVDAVMRAVNVELLPLGVQLAGGMAEAG